jgi:ABC-2 type transport system ATP-binding protein
VVVILSTHIVSDVSDLCGRMAVIDKGEVLLHGAPGELLATVSGKVWRKTVLRTEVAEEKTRSPVISTRLVAGKTVVHAYADSAPAGFEAAEPSLEDVYFAAIHRHLRLPSAAASAS